MWLMGLLHLALWQCTSFLQGCLRQSLRQQSPKVSATRKTLGKAGETHSAEVNGEKSQASPGTSKCQKGWESRVKWNLQDKT